MKTIYKIFAALALLAVIIGISVIKSSVSAKREANHITKIKEEYFKTQDSLLLTRMDDSTRFYIDSIVRMEAYYQNQIDSLNKFYAARDSLRAAEELKRKRDAAAKNNAKKQAVKTTPKEPDVKDETPRKIRFDFDSLLSRLPEDLTKYEMDVSIRELVIDLSNKYKIAPDSVKKVLGKSTDL
jgi:hypothetical protein